MPTDRPQARARLALVFRGANTRWALPASAVLEVGPAPEGEAPVRHGLPIEDFGALFGQRAERSPKSVTLVLDCAPPRALRVEAVEEVADLSAAQFFQLPEGLSSAHLVRGAVLHRALLALELVPQALADFRPEGPLRAKAPQLATPDQASARPPGRSLVLEAGELGAVGVPLSLVTGVVRALSVCPVPFAAEGHRGLMHHEGSILSLYDLALLAGHAPVQGELAVALDVSGRALAVLASRVVGVLEGFGGEPQSVPGGVRWRARDARHVLFPELERWVFPAAKAPQQN